MVHIQEWLAEILNVDAIFGAVVFGERLETLAGEVAGGIQMGAHLEQSYNHK